MAAPHLWLSRLLQPPSTVLYLWTSQLEDCVGQWALIADLETSINGKPCIHIFYISYLLKWSNLRNSIFGERVLMSKISWCFIQNCTQLSHLLNAKFLVWRRNSVLICCINESCIDIIICNAGLQNQLCSTIHKNYSKLIVHIFNFQFYANKGCPKKDYKKMFNDLLDIIVEPGESVPASSEHRSGDDQRTDPSILLIKCWASQETTF